MGKNFVFNLIEKGLILVVYDKNLDVGVELLSCVKVLGLVDCLYIVFDLNDMVRCLELFCLILFLVFVGELVDKVCIEFVEVGVDSDDIIVDCGNSNYKDGISCKFKY